MSSEIDISTPLIDTHCHVNFASYDEDRAAVIQRSIQANVTRIIIPATDLLTSQQAIDLSVDYTGIYAAVGVHPNSTAAFDPGNIEALKAMAQREKVIAIGEIGLDYYWDDSPEAMQKRAFEQQLELAAKLELPVIIHNRDASDDVMAILEAWVKTLPESLKHRPGVMHSFSAPLEIAERALSAGFYLGFTGPITFKKAEDLRRIAAAVPTDRLLVETDGPFLTPHPFRGKRNEPAYIPLIVDRLAALHHMPANDMGRMTTENAERLFLLSAAD